jgi:hypothetical protein
MSMMTMTKKPAPPRQKMSKKMTRKRPICSAAVRRGGDAAAPRDPLTQIGKKPH